MSNKQIQLLWIALISSSTWASFTYAQSTQTTTPTEPAYNPFFVVSDDEEKMTQAANNRPPRERGCGSGTLSWSSNDHAEVPGIYWAYLRTYCRDGLEIILWTDFETSFFGGAERARSSGRMITDADSYHGRRGNSQIISGMVEANARITYEFELSAENDGTALINDYEFDLAEGLVFLIASKNGDVAIRQVQYNTAGISAQDLKLLAASYPEIKEFFENYHE